MCQILKYLPILSFFIPHCVIADVNWLPEHSRLVFGAKSYLRDYHELSSDPNFKSDEFGLLYGYQIGFERKAPQRWMYELTLNFDHGSTAYDGSMSMNFGDYRPYKGTTNNIFMQIDSNVGYTFTFNPKHLITPFLGFRIHGWGRVIDQENAEVYSISNAQLGVQYDYAYSPKLNLGLRMVYQPMLAGEMLLEHADEPIVILGDKDHYELSFPMHYRFEDKSIVRITPFYRYQQFGKSNSARLYWNAYYFEPASRNHVVGLKADFLIGNE